MNEKTIDDIINQSDLVNAIASMSSDATNVEARDQILPDENWDEGLQMRMPSEVERTGDILSSEDILNMIMGSTGGGIKGLKKAGSTLFDLMKKSSKAPPSTPKILETPMSKLEMHGNLWKALTEGQKKSVSGAYGKAKEFDFDEFTAANKALSMVKSLSNKEVGAPIGNALNFMLRKPTGSALPQATLPQRVSEASTFDEYPLMEIIKFLAKNKTSKKSLEKITKKYSESR